MKTTVGQAYHDHENRVGARVRLEFDTSEGWADVVDFATHGMTPAEIAAHRDHLVAEHRLKSAKLDELHGLIGTRIGQHVVECATIRPRGINHELIVHLRGADGTRLDVERRFNTIADVPPVAEILAMATEAAGEHSVRAAAVEAFGNMIASALAGNVQS